MGWVCFTLCCVSCVDRSVGGVKEDGGGCMHDACMHDACMHGFVLVILAMLTDYYPCLSTGAVYYRGESSGRSTPPHHSTQPAHRTRPQDTAHTPTKLGSATQHSSAHTHPWPPPPPPAPASPPPAAPRRTPPSRPMPEARRPKPARLSCWRGEPPTFSMSALSEAYSRSPFIFGWWWLLFLVGVCGCGVGGGCWQGGGGDEWSSLGGGAGKRVWVCLWAVGWLDG